jgi:hypothetical protein
MSVYTSYSFIFSETIPDGIKTYHNVTVIFSADILNRFRIATSLVLTF